MKNSIFKILKYSYYAEGKRTLEQYEISMGGSDSFMCVREELIDLQKQIALALNDRKEEQNEK